MTIVSQADLITGAIAGKVVSFPTDTVPALAVKPESASLIFQLKQRPDRKPLILMGASLASLLPYVAGTPQEVEVWQQVMKQYFPGAITFVLPASSQVPRTVNPLDTTTIGIRIPDCAIACQILEQTGVLATSSANISGEETLTDPRAIDKAFPNVLVLEPKGSNISGSGLPSTVVKWTSPGWTVLRQGSITIN
ncbi:MAG: L-threonylcarbamoyladenylate synthase [Pleurocapsa sp.]